jgi:hypothetical protein
MKRRTFTTVLSLWRVCLMRSLWSIRARPIGPSITRKLFALIARAHQMLGNLQGALAVCAEGLSFVPDDAELHFRKAVLHRTSSQPVEAQHCRTRILTLRPPEQFCSVDQGIYGHLTRRNLAVLAQERGDVAEAASFIPTSSSSPIRQTAAGRPRSDGRRPARTPVRWWAERRATGLARRDPDR